MFTETLRRHWGTLGFLLLLAWFGYFQGLQALMMILGAAMIHEAGHLLALRVFGAAGRFFFSPGGVMIRTEAIGLSYFQEIIAVLAGPAANLAVGILLSTLSGAYPILSALAGAHWILGIFNLLPAAPLDGWRFLQLLLCWLLGPDTGNRLSAVLGGVGTLLLAAGILFLMGFSGGNLWLLPAAAATAVSGACAVRREL